VKSNIGNDEVSGLLHSLVEIIRGYKTQKLNGN